MAEVLHGNGGGNQINVGADKTQVYGLKGNDTLASDGKRDVLLIGGSGDDNLIMAGGNGTLSGGDGNDTFELTYSATKSLSAVIEDFTSEDKIVVNFEGDTEPQLSSSVSGNDVVWSDGTQLNVTLKSVRENDYFDGDASEQAWNVLRLTNAERDKKTLEDGINRPMLTMSDGLTNAAQIRAEEMVGGDSSYIDHTRPDGTGYETVFDEVDKYYLSHAENLDAGGDLDTPALAMSAWIGSDSHNVNIWNPNYLKLGVGYAYEDTSYAEHYWEQLFADSLRNPETVSTARLSTANITVNTISASKLITLSDGGATYQNTVEGATIQGGNGNDSIGNSYANVSIKGNAGDDTIKLDLAATGNVIAYASGDGKDLVSGFDGNDTLQIGGGSGTYSTQTSGSDLIVTVGTGKITLQGAAGLSTLKIADVDNTPTPLHFTNNVNNTMIECTDLDDTITNNGNNVTIAALGGDDSIDNYGANVSIVGGAGDDTIKLDLAATGNVIAYAAGDGSDNISGFDDNDTLQIGGGSATYSTQVSGSDLIVTVGTGKITLQGATNLAAVNIAGISNTDTTPTDTTPIAVSIDNTINNTLITGTELNDAINNNGSNVTIAALGGNDSIFNSGARVSISGAAGNDSIQNDADNVSINTGDGSDTVYNDLGSNASINTGTGDDSVLNGGGYFYGESSNSNITIDTGLGDDTVRNYGSDASINTGAGNDSVYNSRENVTISGDTGNDRISLDSYATDNLINYASGDGNDFIQGFDGNDTLLIGGGSSTYTTSVSGSDLIVTVGEGSITLAGAAGSSIHINDEVITPSVSPEPTPVYGKSITLTEGDDNYSNTVEGATILALGGNDSIYNSRDYANVSIDGGNDNDTLNNYGVITTVNGGAGNDSIYNDGGGVIVLGGEGNDSVYNDTHNVINNEYGYVTISTGAGDDSIYNNDPRISINGDAGNDVIDVHGWYRNTVSGGGGNDSIYIYGSENDLIEYTPGDGNDSIHGFNETSTLQIADGDGTYSTQKSGDDVIVTIGDGSVLLEGAASLSVIHINDYDRASTIPSSKFITLSSYPDNYTNAAEGVTIVALGGNDTLVNDFANVSISADTGDDRISLSGSGTNSTLKYATGDGNDTVWGGNTETTIEIFGEYSTVNSGNDFIVKVGTGSIRCVGGRIRPPRIVKGASGTSGGVSGSNSGAASGGGSAGGAGNSSGGGQTGGGTNAGGSGSSGGSAASGNSSGNGGYSGSSGSRGGGGHSRYIRNDHSTTANAPTASTATVLPEPITQLNHQTTATTQQPAATATQHVYAGGNQVVSNYRSGDKIVFGATYTGAFYDGNGNFFAGSTTGALAVQNATDKVIDLADAAGNSFVKAYAATTAGVIDGRGLAGFEVINGSAGGDVIYAGDGGSQLWGGADVATDMLVGGNGTDIFIGGRTQGADYFLNASSADVVHLNDSTLSDIVTTAEENGTIGIAFNTGNVIAVQSSEALSAAVMLADGSAYRYNHATKSWQSA